jgi:2-succinyl-6-hydroxy-2,4-cyclohexadiene-1-carboxylate synthase
VRPALVLLHGFTQTRQSWRLTVAALAGRYRAIAPDLPGHGQMSERRPASLAATLAYLRALVEGPHDLAGYSQGGRIALHAALARPEAVRRLVLIGASPGIADVAERAARGRADAELADRIEAIGVEAFAREWAALPLWEGQPESVRAAADADRRSNTAAGLADALRGLGTGTLPSLWDRLGELSMPVLLVVGERDARFRAIAERMAERIPDPRIAVIPGAGHAAQLEQPELVATAIRGQTPQPSSPGPPGTAIDPRTG